MPNRIICSLIVTCLTSWILIIACIVAVAKGNHSYLQAFPILTLLFIASAIGLRMIEVENERK